jgi:phosphoribosyl 1,2-cyclic phosphodiesterase
MCEHYVPENAELSINIIDSHTSFHIQDIAITPYPVPHDAREPTQFTFTDGQYKLGVLTDAGSSTPYIEQMLSGCDALVLECNHDLHMLENGPYAWPLKKRVGSRLGHLDNQTAAALLARLDNSKLKHIIAAHLSAKNNTQNLAKQALSQALSCELEWVGIAEQAEGFAWRSLN